MGSQRVGCDLVTNDFLGSSNGKNQPAMRETWIRFLSRDDPLEKGMAAHSSILVWRIPRTEEPGGLQSMGSERVGHDRVTKGQDSRSLVNE